MEKNYKKTKKYNINQPIKWYHKVVLFIGKSFMRILFPTKIFFAERMVYDRQALFICNHYSFFDQNPIISRLFNSNCNVVVKEELLKFPLAKVGLNSVGAIPIKRGEADLDAIKNIIKLLKNGHQILIFPEGTRNPVDVKEMLPFKDGTANFALKTHATIVPMIHYRKPSIWRKNYLIVGKPFELTEFYDEKSTPEIKEKATQIIRESMLDTRQEIDNIVEKFGGNQKKYIESLSNNLED